MSAAEPRTSSTLERFALEKAPRLDENEVSNFVAAGPRRVEGNPSASPQAGALSPSVSDHVPDHGPDHEGPAVESEPSVEGEKLVDLRQIANYAGFLAGSIRRHKILAAGTFSLALAMTAAAAFLMPRTYHAEAKLLAQRNDVMAALSNPGRSVPWDADAPTRAAAETVLRRDNLISLIRQTNLVEEWDRTRAPILKLKDWLMASRSPAPADSGRKARPARGPARSANGGRGRSGRRRNGHDRPRLAERRNGVSSGRSGPTDLRRSATGGGDGRHLPNRSPSSSVTAARFTKTSTAR